MGLACLCKQYILQSRSEKGRQMRKLLIAGNWKMNGTQDSVSSLLGGLIEKCTSTDVDWLVCHSFLYLAEARAALKGTVVALGAQNVCDQESGAFTGEVSPNMLKEAGCTHVIVGHSERRHVYKESNELVSARFFSALDHALVPILCVGETLDQREADQTLDIVFAQIDAVLKVLPAGDVREWVLAYEPVWAIGTGKTATPEQAQQVHDSIRKKLQEHDAQMAESVRILYGGSVKPSNATELFAMADIDGALVGGASLSSDDFSDLAR